MPDPLHDKLSVSLTNLYGIPFRSPLVAIVARKLWFVNWPSIQATFLNPRHNFHTKLQNVQKIFLGYFYNLVVGIRPSARDDGTAILSLTTARVAEEADPRSAVSWGDGWDGWFLPSFLFCLF